MTQTSNTFKGKATRIKFTMLEKNEGEIMIGCEQEDEDSIDAIVSMLKNTFILEHNKREIISIKLVK